MNGGVGCGVNDWGISGGRRGGLCAGGPEDLMSDICASEEMVHTEWVYLMLVGWLLMEGLWSE